MAYHDPHPEGERFPSFRKGPGNLPVSRGGKKVLFPKKGPLSSCARGTKTTSIPRVRKKKGGCPLFGPAGEKKRIRSIMEEKKRGKGRFGVDRKKRRGPAPVRRRRPAGGRERETFEPKKGKEAHVIGERSRSFCPKKKRGDERRGDPPSVPEKERKNSWKKKKKGEGAWSCRSVRRPRGGGGGEGGGQPTEGGR